MRLGRCGGRSRPRSNLPQPESPETCLGDRAQFLGVDAHHELATSASGSDLHRLTRRTDGDELDVSPPQCKSTLRH